jgi:RNA polymerase sigma-54 factor
MPSIEATLTRGTSLFDHLEWQLKLTRGFSKEEEGVALLIIGNLTPDGYLDVPVEELAEEAGVEVSSSWSRCSSACRNSTRPAWPRAICKSACSSRRATWAPTTTWCIGIISKHLHNLEKRNYAAIAKDLNQPLEEVYEATKVVLAFDPKPGRAYTDEESNYITPDVHIQKVGDKYFVVANDDGLPKLKISDFYRVALCRKVPRRASTFRNVCAAPSG